MRRIALILSVAACIVAAGLVVTTSAQSSDTYKFDVIFDDARGLVGGQVVKIAGAQAGTISNVVVTANDKARVEAEIPAQFRFHTDASCSIRPEGLIAENYVECDPGSAGAPLLQGRRGFPPTVPVTQTTEPVSLMDLFNIFNLPTRERFQVLVDELGIGTAGEGDNLNAILRRANPALALANQVIGILDAQRKQIIQVIDATSTIARTGAEHTAEVQAFLQRASGLAELTAAHSGSLSTDVHRLPGLLRAAQPALSQLDTVARDGTPLLSSLRAATPALDRVDTDLGPFVRVASPGLSAVAGAIERAIPTIKRVTPLVRTLHRYVDVSKGTTAKFAKLAESLQRSGFFENFLSIFYYTAGAMSRKDSVSHLLSLLLVGPDHGACGSYDATAPIADCDAHYGSLGSTSSTSSSKAAASSKSSTTATSRTSSPTATSSGSSTAAASSKSSPTAPPKQALQGLLSYLLR